MSVQVIFITEKTWLSKNDIVETSVDMAALKGLQQWMKRLR